MGSIRRRLRVFTWVALLAMVAIALGPTISRLTVPEEPSRGDVFALDVPVDHGAMHRAAMSTGAIDAQHRHVGVIAATAAPASPPTSPPHCHTLERCALCAVAASAFAVAPPPPTVMAVATVRRQVAVLAERGLVPGRSPWSPATSRGPPALA
jgi:hypothetical protein